MKQQALQDKTYFTSLQMHAKVYFNSSTCAHIGLHVPFVQGWGMLQSLLTL